LLVLCHAADRSCKVEFAVCVCVCVCVCVFLLVFLQKPPAIDFGAPIQSQLLTCIPREMYISFYYNDCDGARKVHLMF